MPPFLNRRDVRGVFDLGLHDLARVDEPPLLEEHLVLGHDTVDFAEQIVEDVQSVRAEIAQRLRPASRFENQL